MADLPDILIALHGRHDGLYENKTAAMAYGVVIEIGVRRFEAWGYGRLGDTQSVKAIGFNEAVQFCFQESERFDDDPDKVCLVCVTRDGDNFSKMANNVLDDLANGRPPHVDQGDDWQEHLLLKNLASPIFRKPTNAKERMLLARAEALAGEKAALAKQERSSEPGLRKRDINEVAL